MPILGTNRSSDYETLAVRRTDPVSSQTDRLARGGWSHDDGTDAHPRLEIISSRHQLAMDRIRSDIDQ